jgi:hypothetical protein
MHRFCFLGAGRLHNRHGPFMSSQRNDNRCSPNALMGSYIASALTIETVLSVLSRASKRPLRLCDSPCRWPGESIDSVYVYGPFQFAGAGAVCRYDGAVRYDMAPRQVVGKQMLKTRGGF